jgi:hypothetical protein
LPQRQLPDLGDEASQRSFLVSASGEASSSEGGLSWQESGHAKI